MIIEKLDKDFSEPCFRWKKDRSAVHDLGDISYVEVTFRMVRLMDVVHQDR